MTRFFINDFETNPNEMKAQCLKNQLKRNILEKRFGQIFISTTYLSAAKYSNADHPN